MFVYEEKQPKFGENLRNLKKHVFYKEKTANLKKKYFSYTKRQNQKCRYRQTRSNPKHEFKFFTSEKVIAI